jgi:hypothetical protein
MKNIYRSCTVLGLLSFAACAELDLTGSEQAPVLLYDDATSDSEQRAKLQRDIEDVLARTPGARQISATEIEVGPGLIMKLSPVGAVATNELGEATLEALEFYCSQLYICVFNNKNFNVGSTNGTQLNFTTCGREWNLGNVAFPGGGWWNDKVSSIINNQSTNTWTYFYDYRGSGNWLRVTSLNAGHHLANLELDKAEDNGRLNDRIDGVHVCGSAPSPWRPNWP